MTEEGLDGPRPGHNALRLPYRITDHEGFEIARAASAPIALAMFQAALREYATRSLLLSKDGELIFQRFV